MEQLNIPAINKTALHIALILLRSDLRPGEQLFALNEAKNLTTTVINDRKRVAR